MRTVVFPDQWGNTPLHWASTHCNAHSVELLLNAGESVCTQSTTDKKTPLHTAAKGNNVDTARILLKRGAKIKARDTSGRTALHYASCAGSIDVVRVLLKAGANPEAQDNYGRTPLAITVKLFNLLGDNIETKKLASDVKATIFMLINFGTIITGEIGDIMKQFGN